VSIDINLDLCFNKTIFKGAILGPAMKKAFKRSECFLIVLFSCWFLVVPAYLNFTLLDDSDMTPSYPAIGKIDQEELILGSAEKEKILGSAFSAEHIYIVHLSLALVSRVLIQPPPLDATSLILRC